MMLRFFLGLLRGLIMALLAAVVVSLFMPLPPEKIGTAPPAPLVTLPGETAPDQPPTRLPALPGKDGGEAALQTEAPQPPSLKTPAAAEGETLTSEDRTSAPAPVPGTRPTLIRPSGAELEAAAPAVEREADGAHFGRDTAGVSELPESRVITPATPEAAGQAAKPAADTSRTSSDGAGIGGEVSSAPLPPSPAPVPSMAPLPPKPEEFGTNSDEIAVVGPQSAEGNMPPPMGNPAIRKPSLPETGNTVSGESFETASAPRPEGGAAPISPVAPLRQEGAAMAEVAPEGSTEEVSSAGTAEAPSTAPLPAKPTTGSSETPPEADRPLPPPVTPEKLPAFIRFALPVDTAPGQPQMAILIVDIGEGGVSAEDLSSLPAGITLVVDPRRGKAKERAIHYRSKGHEVAVLLPASFAPSTFAEEIADWPVVALVDLEKGGRARRDRAASLASRAGLGLVLGSDAAPAEIEAIRARGLPAGRIFQVLDDEGESSFAMRRILTRSALKAKEEGRVILAAHSLAPSVEAITKWMDTLSARSVSLAPITAVLLEEGESAGE